MQRMTLKIDNLEIKGNEHGITHRSVDGVSLSVEDVEDTALVTSAPPTERTYEMICEDSRKYVDATDFAAWCIGDNAIAAVASGHTLDDYAKDIRKPKGTVREYHKMSTYFDETTRAELYTTCPNISRSHMRKVLSIKDVEKGRAFVEHASRKGWTVDQFGFMLKRYKRIAGIGRRVAPRPERKEFEASYAYVDRIVYLPAADAMTFDKLVHDHPDATITVLVTWTP